MVNAHVGTNSQVHQMVPMFHLTQAVMQRPVAESDGTQLEGTALQDYPEGKVNSAEPKILNLAEADLSTQKFVCNGSHMLPVAQANVDFAFYGAPAGLNMDAYGMSQFGSMPPINVPPGSNVVLVPVPVPAPMHGQHNMVGPSMPYSGFQQAWPADMVGDHSHWFAQAGAQVAQSMPYICAVDARQ
jgi:hypothetical protein